MKKRHFGTLWSAVLLVGLSGTAQATLIERGGGLIYDDDLDVTWYDFSHDRSDRFTQIDWAADLSVTLDGRIYDDWRLPASDNMANCIGSGCIDSEMGYLFHQSLGNSAGGPLGNSGPFRNLNADFYWSGTSSWAGSAGWAFNFSNGDQKNNWSWHNQFYALAVRDGDVVSTASVPLPATAWLMGTGLLGLLGAGVSKRRSATGTGRHGPGRPAPRWRRR